MAFHVEECAVELNTVLQPLVLCVQRRDRALADQLSRAAASVALNIAEANGSDPGNRRARFFTASGSARETRTALRLGVARRYYVEEDATAALALVDRVLAMLWRLTRK
ncbi:MAG TPA: four helix bundle protein [Polyangiaceae bacterium]|nr:four helix bundle protein [Polyangiaceae bacterium]